MSDTARIQAIELTERPDHGVHGYDAHELGGFGVGFSGAAGFADAETLEILNLLGDAAAGGSCCGGSCCTPGAE